MSDVKSMSPASSMPSSEIKVVVIVTEVEVIMMSSKAKVKTYKFITNTIIQL